MFFLVLLSYREIAVSARQHSWEEAMNSTGRMLSALLCAAALISLPTLQSGSAGQDVAILALAPVREPSPSPEYSEAARAAAGRQGGPRSNPTVAEAAAAAVESSAAPSAASGSVADNGTWLWPTSSQLITSGFGYRADPITGGGAFHSGTDFGAACGALVGATRPGTVTFAGAAGGYGYRVVIDHGAGISSSYSHLQEISVPVGASVGMAGLVGMVGTTGRSTGCHLHFEIMVNGGFADPMPYLMGNPVANPTVFGNATVAAAPLPTSVAPSSSASPTPTVPEDPCGISNDPQEALESGGLIPVEPSVGSSESPCPTPLPTSESPSPSTTPSSSQTPVATNESLASSSSATPSTDPSLGQTTQATPTDGQTAESVAASSYEPEPTQTPQEPLPLQTPQESLQPEPTVTPDIVYEPEPSQVTQPSTTVPTLPNDEGYLP